MGRSAPATTRPPYLDPAADPESSFRAATRQLHLSSPAPAEAPPPRPRPARAAVPPNEPPNTKRRF